MSLSIDGILAKRRVKEPGPTAYTLLASYTNTHTMSSVRPFVCQTKIKQTLANQLGLPGICAWPSSALWYIPSMLRSWKGYCSHSFRWSWVAIKLKHILAMCQKLKLYGTLKITYLNYIVSIHKGMLVSSSKGQTDVKAPDPLVKTNYGILWNLYTHST